METLEQNQEISVSVPRRMNRSANAGKPRVYDALPNPPNAIHALRWIKGLSPSMISERTGIQSSAIRRAERVSSGAGIGPDKWKLLAKLLECSPYELRDPDYPSRAFPEEYAEYKKQINGD